MYLYAKSGKLFLREYELFSLRDITLFAFYTFESNIKFKSSGSKLSFWSVNCKRRVIELTEAHAVRIMGASFPGYGVSRLEVLMYSVISVRI